MSADRKRLLQWLGVIAVGISAFFLFQQSRYTGPMPHPIALQKSDFMIFGGGYSAQVRDGFRPRGDVAAIHLQLPLNWNMNPFQDRNWRFQLSSWRMLNPVWSHWYGRDWKRLGDEVMPWIHDWYVYHVAQRKSSDFDWYDMAAGYRAQHLAMVLWLQKNGQLALTPEQLREVHELARWHIEKLRDPDFITHGNHAIFQIQGLRLLCLTWPGAGCRGEEAYSSRLMGKLLHSQFGEQGVHTENSPAYHLFVLKTFERIRPALYPPIEQDFKHTLAAAREVAPWFTLPDGRVVPMGDSSGNGAKFAMGAVPPCSSRDLAGSCIISKDIVAGGYAVVRTAPGTRPANTSMLIVDGASVAPKSHDHADELSFVLYNDGRPLLVDSGKFSYNHDQWRDYFQSDRAHNLVGVLGQSFGPADTITDGSALKGMTVKNGIYVVTGRVERKGLTHQRRLTYRPGVSLVVADRVEGDKRMRPVVYWHLAPGLSAQVTGDEVDITAAKDVLARLSLQHGECKPTIVKGQSYGSIQGWVSPSYMKRLPAVVVEYRCAAGVRDIQTRIALGQHAAKASFAPASSVHMTAFSHERMEVTQ
jgi:hypothetical protein